MHKIRDNETLGAVLLDRLAADPAGVACRLVHLDGSCESVSVSRLMHKAMAYAERFGPARPHRKIIGVSLYHGLDLHAAFVGALLAGHIPTMLAPPSPRMEPGKYTSSLVQMLRHMKPDHLVLDGRVYEELDRLAVASASDVSVIDSRTIPDSGKVDSPQTDPDAIALIQHSSGTTGLQKGIALSHRAILAHNRIYSERLGLGPDDVIVSWLPLYHDMGFIACFLLPLLQGIRFVEISPFDWVRKPGLLFEQIDKNKATLCWLPNFAYSFIAESVRPRDLQENLDLSTIRAWINCSEAVYHSSHMAFLKRFEPYGANRSQFTASYAMAENVFAVTQSLPDEYRTLRINREIFTSTHRAEPYEGADALIFVSNGRVLDGTELAVADDAGHILPSGHVGELLIRGVHRFIEYFGRDDLTRAAVNSEGWYRTGDLGFLHDGELYVTGRKKDLLIIQGRNFYPTDVEEVVGKVPGIAPGRVVAFGLADEASGTERMVVLAEAGSVSVNDKRLALAVRNHVAQELDCTPGDVRIVPSRWLIKSTSGKIARADNRRKYIEQFLPLKP